MNVVGCKSFSSAVCLCVCRIAREMAERGHEIMVRPSTPSDSTSRNVECMQIRRIGWTDPSDVRSEGIARIGMFLSWLEVFVARGMPMKLHSVSGKVFSVGQSVRHLYALTTQGGSL